MDTQTTEIRLRAGRTRRSAGLIASPSESRGGAERRKTPGLSVSPASGWRSRPRDACASLRPVAIRDARLSALDRGFFRSRVTLSRRLEPPDQPAPGGGAVVRPRWSPGPPERELVRLAA